MPTVDLVIPIYNEQDALPGFHNKLRQSIDSIPCDFTIYYIDDGSTDTTGDCLHQIAATDQRVVVVELSRNFGHQAALTAGLDLSESDYTITLDGDGQHPPEMIAEMLELAGRGFDVVLTQRKEDAGPVSMKRRTSALFYRLINQIGDTHVLPGSADFRLLSRPAVRALCGMREYHRFLRGMVSWAGFRTAILPYEQAARIDGSSKYTARKMLHLSADAIFSFSLVPLYIGIGIGLLFLVMAFLEMVYVLSFWVSGNQASLAPGWSSLMFMLLIVGGSLMITLGVIGLYVGYIFQEVKHRPIYIVRSTTNHRSDN